MGAQTGNDQLKTRLRGPVRILRSRSPDMVRQEIDGYLLAHQAISALICHAATEARSAATRKPPATPAPPLFASRLFI